MNNILRKNKENKWPGMILTSVSSLCPEKIRSDEILNTDYIYDRIGSF